MADAISTSPNTAGRDGPHQTQSALSKIEEIAHRWQVPASILIAVAERSGATDDSQRIAVAERAAEQIAPRLAAGEAIEDIIAGSVTDKRVGQELIERARTIAQDLDRDRAAQPPAEESESALPDQGPEIDATDDSQAPPSAPAPDPADTAPRTSAPDPETEGPAVDPSPAARPDPIGKKDGSPFGDTAKALRALKARGLDPEAFDLQDAPDGGVYAFPKTEAPEDAGSLAVAFGALPAGGESVAGPAAPTEDVAPDAPAPSPESPEAPQAASDGAVERRRDGTPFKSEDAAWRALANRGRDPSNYAVVPEGDGYVARPVTDADQGEEGRVLGLEAPTAPKGGGAGTTEAPAEAEVQEGGGGQDVSDLDAAAANADPAPTEAQKKAGNYRMAHVRVQGLDITIENAKGSERRGTAPDGSEWSVTMPAHYGYFRRSEGADGDHVDVYIGDRTESEYVVIVNQADAETGRFDEHKAVLGTTNRGEALDLYRNGFSDGKADDRIGSISILTMDGFKEWLAGDTSKPTKPLDFPYLNGRQTAAKRTAAGGAGSTTGAATSAPEASGADARSGETRAADVSAATTEASDPGNSEGKIATAGAQQPQKVLRAP